MSVKAMKSGAKEFLTKPLNEQQFLNAVSGRTSLGALFSTLDCQEQAGWKCNAH